MSITSLKRAAVIGAGPAGLMAAEEMARAGLAVRIYDQMPSPARKFLMAGRGGLNLTHGEAQEKFLSRYGAAAGRIAPFIAAFSQADLRAWSAGLGEPTFEGSSGRIFPKSFKASPLLRAWLRRLEGLGVVLETRHRLADIDASGAPVILDAAGARIADTADVHVLALGGASWPRLGSDGRWPAMLRAHGVKVHPLLPANCGFETHWSEQFVLRFAGTPLKPVRLSFECLSVRGEAMVTQHGLEGGAIYALSARLRDAIIRDGHAMLEIDLRPDLEMQALAERLARPRQGQSTSSFLRKAAGLSGVAIGLLREVRRDLPADPLALSDFIKSLRLRLDASRPIARAISSAGGIAFSEVDEGLMLKRLPGIFVSGEMLDWEAPTGGYLLQASFATGAAAGRAAARYAAAPERCAELRNSLSGSTGL